MKTSNLIYSLEDSFGIYNTTWQGDLKITLEETSKRKPKTPINLVKQ